MPCRGPDPDPYEPIRRHEQQRKLIDELTRLLCKACEALDLTGALDERYPELHVWKLEHDEQDRLRSKKEKIEALQTKKRVLQKKKGLEKQLKDLEKELKKLS